MSTVLTNPAAAPPRQQAFPFCDTERRYWDSLPVDRHDHLFEAVDVLLDYDRCLVPDPCLIAIPVALNKNPFSSNWSALELLDMEHSALFPTLRTGAMRRIARSILREFTPADRIGAPWSRTYYSEERPLPPWISNKRALDILEKSIRTVVWEAIPEFAAMKLAEERMAEASSRAYLKTGYYAYEHSPAKLPVEVKRSDELMKLVRRADETIADWYSTDVDKLLDAMLIPKHEFYGGDEPFLFSPTTANGKIFGPVTELGLSGDDVATIEGHVEDERNGWTSRWGRRPLPLRCRPSFEALMSFLDETKSREQLEIVEI